MKKYFPILFPVLLFMISGCSKSKEPVITVDPELSIQDIKLPSFLNSSWVNVAGGTLLVKIDAAANAPGGQASVTDSLTFSNLASYHKKLAEGHYDINISSKYQTAIADTFLRFNAQINNYDLAKSRAVSLTASTTDGLITIAKSYIADNTIPFFTSQGASKQYKMGLSNGFYYIYVKAGATGSVAFTAKASGQSVVKVMPAVTTLTHSNLQVIIDKGQLQVIFAKFAYNQLPVGSATLATVNIDLNDYYIAHASSVYFVATDITGNIISELQYLAGTRTFKLNSQNPYEADRFNLFVIINPGDGGKSHVEGYLQVKKGSTYNNFYAVLPQQEKKRLQLYYENATPYDYLLVSSNVNAAISQSLADTTTMGPLTYVDDNARLYAQMNKNNKQTYAFFNVTPDSYVRIDFAAINKTPLVKTVTAPVSNFAFSVYAKSKPDYFDAMVLSSGTSPLNTINVAYPTETFPEYDTYASYRIGDKMYEIVTTGTTIPAKIDGFDATFNVSGTTLANFVPSFSGTFDYYHANFENTNGPGIITDLYSPAAAKFTNIKMPDLSKYLHVTTINLNTQKLTGFQLEQYTGFDEKVFRFKPANAIRSAPDFNAKSVSQGY
ncbi:hypothetical protein ACFGVS_24645 [Mucilaginibacter sp. AW1-7]|uniref:hypothetical protein n=1 Tax=Mucilaginibacter sp. AW1-7 TaxID=3349874 RepID=UPI003F73A572